MRLYFSVLILVLLSLAGTVVAYRKASSALSIATQAAASPRLQRDAERDVSTFERYPSYENLVALEGDIGDSAAQVSIVDRLVAVIADRDLPPNLENALVADL